MELYNTDFLKTDEIYLRLNFWAASFWKLPSFRRRTI